MLYNQAARQIIIDIAVWRGGSGQRVPATGKANTVVRQRNVVDGFNQKWRKSNRYM